MKKTIGTIVATILLSGGVFADVTFKVEGPLNQMKTDNIQKKLKDSLKSTTTVTMDATAMTLVFKGTISESDAKTLVEGEGLTVKK
jgi:signal recognition particle receptor subunit beta